jgi:tRNA dimethylallyltransferase
MTTQLPPAIFLMGPTASGKTSLAIQLAHQFNAEIISVDSALVFRDMDIGTAKPSLAERDTIPHHLIDILDPSESFSTGQFRQQALALMQDIHQRGKLPLLVGGTMLYFNALSQGLAVLPPANSEIRARLDAELAEFGSAILHQRLAEIDPLAAQRIHPNDPQRIQRALEVFELSGQPISSFFANNPELPYRLLKLIIAPNDRAVLHQKIALRFKQMLAQGFIEEVTALYQRGDLNETYPAIRAVGYRQAWAYLKGEDNLTEMTEKAIAATRQLAKRQFTWLRKETDAMQLETDDKALFNKSVLAINEFI